MVSFGDAEFREWAEELELNDADVEIARRKSRNNALKYFLLHLIGGAAGACSTLVPKQYSDILLGIAAICLLIFWLLLSNFVRAWSFAKNLKYGSFNVRPGLFLSLYSLLMFISYASIIPLIISLIGKKRMWGTGFLRLIKKGIIGNH